MSLFGRPSRARRLTKQRRAWLELVTPEETAERATLALRTRETDDPWVDLVHHEPLVTADLELLRHALRFAFESGDAGGLLGRAVDDAPAAPSGWKPESFAGGLFLRELVGSCFTIEIDGEAYVPSQAHLERVLATPPKDLRDVGLRQATLRELVSRPELRSAVERIYVVLRQLRSLLDERPMSPGETVRRKIEVLGCIKTFLDVADEGLAGAASVLSRLHEHARSVRAQGSYERLTQLLDFDAHLATVEVRLVLGSDGRIRDFRMLSARENDANPLVTSAWSRFWSRVVAFFRGYQFGESEVVLRVIDGVFADLEDAVLPCFGLIGDLELYLAALGLKDRVENEGLSVCLPELSPMPELTGEAGPFSLKALFNPLLLLQGIRPTPCDIETRGHDSMVLVTGPNSGGKTRLLQAIALSQLLAHAGLFVPAREARLTAAPTLFVSLVEGAPADQREGRLGTELLRVRDLFEQIEPGTMVILDELCSGTNPSEGIAIFEMVISLLPRLRPQVFVTTHFLDAARELERGRTIERLTFLQVELDREDKPTYQFVPGVAPTSLAHQVAARLGVTREQLERMVDRHEKRLRAPEEAAAQDPHEG
ncbi:MAG: DNA mismatch repair protein [Sandaracinaceae bacterium]|nr:DNA mismatch repair protein [Sandaracinaceae bacterium]